MNGTMQRRVECTLFAPMLQRKRCILHSPVGRGWIQILSSGEVCAAKKIDPALHV